MAEKAITEKASTLEKGKSGIDWAAVERLIRPRYPTEPLHDWQSACRMARQVAYLANGTEAFDMERAKLLCLFYALRDKAADLAQRRAWTRPLRDAGVSLETQTWLWIALDRFQQTPATDEERVAYDAWALEKVGAVGVARAFMRGGREDQPLSETVQALRNILADAVFLTPNGRRLGVRRQVYTRRFLKELEEE